MDLNIRKTRGLRGMLSVPGDKSISHRAVILGSVADGATEINGFLPAEDCLRTVEAFRRMGIEIRVTRGVVRIQGKGLRGLTQPDDVLDMGNSGTGFRLLLGLLAGQSFCSVLTGDDSLRGRPMRRVVEPLRRMGAEILGRDEANLAPMVLLGRPLTGIRYEMPVASAQVKSAMLLAGLQAEGPTTVVEPSACRDHTERMLRAFGIGLKIDGGSVTVNPGGALKACGIQVPGDLSSAAFLIVAALITEDSEVVLRGVGINPTRTGVLDLLRQMGGALRVENTREIGGEPVADIVACSSSLKGIEIDPSWVPKTIDEFPILAVAAACAEGETVVRGAAELRVKESDRIATMAAELTRMGAEVEERPDGMVIRGGRPLAGAVCASHGDHRVAMALAVAGLVASGETRVTGSECIETSYPGFERSLASLRGVVHRPGRTGGAVIAIDGPAGSGKSSAAREVARRLGYLYVDTGSLYRAVGWKTLQDGINIKSKATVAKWLRDLNLGVEPGVNGLRLSIGGEDITDRLRTLEVSRAAASVAMMHEVRKRLLGIQREIGKSGEVVVEGRDIGTVVFPGADIKIFLDASPAVRVERRWKELSGKGVATDLKATQQEIDIRDLKDSKRAIAPLKRAQDAVTIDSTHLSLDEVIEQILKIVDERLGTSVS
jgi:3-phosphoshikimate 1-carboxyvinyltransferase